MNDMFSKDSPQDSKPVGETATSQVIVVRDGERTKIDLVVGKTVGYYLGVAGVKVGLLSGNTASIDGVPVKKGRVIADTGDVVIHVSRNIRNG